MPSYSEFAQAVQDPRSRWEEVTEALVSLKSLLPYFWFTSLSKRVVDRALEINKEADLIELGWDPSLYFYTYSGKTIQNTWLNQILNEPHNEWDIGQELRRLHSEGLQGKRLNWNTYFASVGNLKGLNYTWERQPVEEFEKAWFASLRHKKIESVRFFLDKGIDVNRWTTPSQEIGLQLFGVEDTPETQEIAAALIEKGADPIHGNDRSFFSMALRSQSVPFLNMALRSSLYQDEEGLSKVLGHITYLEMTRYRPPVKLIQHLFKKGANPYHPASKFSAYPTSAVCWRAWVNEAQSRPGQLSEKVVGVWEMLLGEAKALQDQKQLQQETPHISPSSLSSARPSRF
jgi:hypothetical protein